MPCPRRRSRMPREQLVAGNFSPRGTIVPTASSLLFSYALRGKKDI